MYHTTKNNQKTSPIAHDGINKNIKQSRNLFELGSYRKSLKICESIYIVDACHVENLLMMGALHFQLHNISESIFYCQQCIRVDPASAEAHSIIGNCMKELGDTESALIFYHKAIRINPRLADAYNNEASLHFELGNTNAAIKSYKMAMSLDKSHSDAMCNLGNVYKVMGKATDAKEQYLQAIKINPKCAIAWSNLGGIFNECQEFNTAIENYKQAIKISPLFADAHSNLGNALVNLCDSSNDSQKICLAEKSYEESIAIRKDFSIGKGNLSLILQKRGSSYLAIKMLRRALFIEPKFTDALNNLAAIYFENEQFSECLKLSFRALKNKPDHLHVYNNAGIALRQEVIIDLFAV